MASFTLRDVVKASDYLASGPVQSVCLRVVDGHPTVMWEPLVDNFLVNTMPGGSFPSPYDFQKMAERLDRQKSFVLETTVEAESMEEGLASAEDWSERMLDWICFLTLRPVWLLERGELSGSTGRAHTIALRPRPTELPSKIVTHMDLGAPRLLDTRAVIDRFPGDSLAWVLKWYRKSLIATKAEDQFLSCWFALEVLSETIGTEDPQTLICPSCTAEIPLGRVAKSGVLRHMRENLGLSRKAFDRLFDTRSDIVHGRRRLDESFRADIARILPASQFVLVTAVLMQLNAAKRGSGEPAHFLHPVLGNLSKQASGLSVLR